MSDQDKRRGEKVAIVIKGRKRVLSYDDALSYAHTLCCAGRFREADQLFDGLVRMRPRDVHAKIIRARCLAGLERFGECKNTLEEIFAERQAPVAKKLHAAFVFMQLGILSSAVEELSLLTKEHPDLPTAWLFLGDALASTKKFEKAESCWKVAISKDEKAGSVARVARRQLAKLRQARAGPDTATTEEGGAETD